MRKREEKNPRLVFRKRDSSRIRWKFRGKRKGVVVQEVQGAQKCFSEKLKEREREVKRERKREGKREREKEGEKERWRERGKYERKYRK